MAIVDRFVLDVPESWADLDLSGSVLAETRAAALALTESPREKATINDMFRQAREVSRAARRHGALFAAGTATLFEDGLFLGYAMVFAVTAPPGRELTLPVLAAQLSPGGTGGSKAGKAGADRTVSAVTLPNIGQVARITGTEEAQIAADITVRMLTMHTVIPIPGSMGDYLIVTCASPNLPLAADVYELFDAISGTFRFLPVEQPAGT